MEITLGQLIGNFILVTGSFIAVLLLIKKYVWNRLETVLDERSEKVRSDIDRAQAAKDQAEDLLKERQQQLSGTKEEAAAILATAKENAEHQKNQVLAETKAQVERLKENADQEIEQEKAAALASVKEEVANLTVDLTSKILSKELTPEVHSELIDQYIKQLGES